MPTGLKKWLRGEQVILVRLETSPEDIHGMHAAAGILRACGMTSHSGCCAGMGGLVYREQAT